MDGEEGPWGREKPPTPKLPAVRRPRLGLYLWLGSLALAGVMVWGLSRLVPGQLGGVNGFEAVQLLGVLAVVSSGLVYARRVNLGAAARAAVLWAAILILLVVGYAFRDDAATAWIKLRAAVLPAYAVNAGPRTVVIGRGEGGGFYVMGEVNGAPVRFLVDTGSSDIVLGPADAARAGLDVAAMKFTNPNETANGVGYGAPAVVGRLKVGSIILGNVPVSVNQAPLEPSLLGMPFLRRLESFEVKGDQLILHARG